MGFHITEQQGRHVVDMQPETFRITRDIVSAYFTAYTAGMTLSP